MRHREATSYLALGLALRLVSKKMVGGPLVVLLPAACFLVAWWMYKSQSLAIQDRMHETDESLRNVQTRLQMLRSKASNAFSGLGHSGGGYKRVTMYPPRAKAIRKRTRKKEMISQLQAIEEID
jgi:hypothetical protein